jgi:hypothetical protein
MNPPLADPAEIEKTIGLLLPPGGVIEARIPKTEGDGTMSAYFKDRAPFLKAVLEQARRGHAAIYATLNLCKPEIWARAANRFKRHVKVTTADKDILRRRFLLFDFDPVRPSEISSSEEEHRAALKRVYEAMWVLGEEGWPRGIPCDSSNGGHAIYRIDLPNNEESTKLIEKVLRALAKRFDDDVVKLDQTVYNAARITKLYGTVSRKGDPVPDRPHRLSRILEIPENLEVIPRERLEAIAAQAEEPNARTHTPPPPRDESRFDLEGFIGRHLKAREPVAYEGGRKWVLVECPFDPSHATSAAVFERPGGSIGFKCQHYSCTNMHWADVRALFEPRRERRTPPPPSDGGPPRDEQAWPGPRVSVTGEQEEEGEITGPRWPEALRKEAYHGLAGEIVRAIEPHSEADPAALLIQFLVMFGNAIGRTAHFRAEADRHYANLFAVLVGPTAKGRKGTSYGQVMRVTGPVDAQWAQDRAMSGLASGEGLIWAVRDEIRERHPIRQGGRVVNYEEVVSDPGVLDKRLLVHEPEFARVLQVIERETNTLSAIIRQSWDSGTLRILTKKQAARATDGHISIIGHITCDELRRLLTDTSTANGFANRILWGCVKRSKLLPEGGALDAVQLEPILRRLSSAMEFARTAGEMRMDDSARAVWRAVYPELSEGKPGMLGAVTSRAEPQVLRIAMIYALLDRAARICAPHLLAALEVWRYMEDSARYIFGDALGDPTADEILRELRRQRPGGMTRTEIREHFQRNKKSAEVGRALGVLMEYGLVRVEKDERDDPSQKRPSERWFAV